MGSLIKYFKNCRDCKCGVVFHHINDKIDCNFQDQMQHSIENAMANCPFRHTKDKMIKLVLQEDKPNP